MYKLYFLQGACSLATQVVLNELNQPVELIDKTKIADFTSINPVGTVPVLVDNDQTLTEGAAIMLHILTKHQSTLLPPENQARSLAIRNIMFANATMHPAYSRLFFIAQSMDDDNAKQQAFKAAEKAISHLWDVVEHRLANQPFLGGTKVSAADIMLTVYSTWGENFPVDIRIGARSQQMLERVKSMNSYRRAVALEQEVVNAN